MARWLAVLWLALAAVTGAVAAEPVSLPPLTARVTDLTATLRADERAALESALARIEQQKGAQVAILLLPTVKPETIEEFAIRIAEAWKLGRRGVDDGVIVIVAKEDRRMRIEVGYGLEGVIPDAVAKRIVAERMAPRFKQGDFAGGLAAAVEAIGGLIGAEGLPPPTLRSGPGRGSGAAGSGDSDYFGVLAGVVMFGWILRRLLGILGSLLVAGAAAWLALMVFGGWLAPLLAGIVALILSFVPMRGGYLPGGSWSSRGGGGFSGGGGGFGGGGASGNW